MGGVLLDGDGRFGGVGAGGWFSAGEVDLTVGRAREDVGAAERGEGDGVDGGGVRGQRVDEAGGKVRSCHRVSGGWEAKTKATVMVK